MIRRNYLSVLYPTMRRVERAKKSLRLLLETTAGYPLEVIPIVDEDLDTKQQLEKLLEEHASKTEGFLWKVVFNEKRVGGVMACNLGLAETTGEYIFGMADDSELQPEWLDAAMNAMKTFPTGGGMVGINDGVFNGAPATHCVVSRWFLAHYMGGVWGFPRYMHYGSDSEATDRAKRAGRFIYCEKARVVHLTYSKGRERDSVDRQDECGGPDGYTYEKIRREGIYPDDFEPIVTKESVAELYL